MTWMIIEFAATIATLGAIDSLLTSVIADNITKTKHNSHRELIGQGIGNIGQILGQQPNIIGWLLVMLGIVVIWGGVYNQLTNPRRVTVVSRVTVVNGE